MSVLEQVLCKTQEARIPFWMHLDLTYRCHQRCLHCYIPEAWRQGEGPEPELTTDQVKGILDQLAAAGTFFLALSGGEVFLRPDLTAILEHARKQNFAISLMTSGTLGVSRDILRFLAELGLNGLLMTMFSVDPTVHDHLGDLYEKTGRIRLAAAQWEISLTEYQKSAPSDVEPGDVARVEKKLESARVKLAKQESAAGQAKPE